MGKKERSDPDCRECKQALRRESANEDFIFDVCNLPSIPVEEKPCNKLLLKQYSHAVDGEGKAAATADFLQEALQERLENETATSLLIAEITDMKARLDDLLAVPSRGDPGGEYEDRKEDGFEHENFKISYSSSDWEHDRTNTMQLMEREATGDFAKHIQEAEKPERCLHQKYVKLSEENQPANRMSCCTHNFCLNHANKNESKVHPRSASNTSNTATTEQRKWMGSKLQSRPELKALVLQQQNNGEIFSHNGRVVAGATKASNCNHAFLSSHNQHDKLDSLKRVSQESCELESDKDMFACMEEDIDEKTIISETTTRCNVTKENPSSVAKVGLTKDKYSDAASNLSPSHKSTNVKPLHCSKVGQETSFCLRSRKDSGELHQFLNAEKSLLSSLERLDGKLAMAFTNISNSSRTSLVSAGRQSTKSAPCVLGQKPRSDAYSINSTLFFARPTTVHTGVLSLRRRQNVGLTNVPKDRNSKVQTCNMQQSKSCEAHPSSKHKEERKSSAGTIIVHQNAEFLFS